MARRREKPLRRRADGRDRNRPAGRSGRSGRSGVKQRRGTAVGAAAIIAIVNVAAIERDNSANRQKVRLRTFGSGPRRFTA